MPRPLRPGTLPALLASVLILAIAVAFSPRYWPIAVALGAMSLLGIFWAITADSFHLDAASVPAYLSVALISVWGCVQLAVGASVAPWLTGRASLNWLGFGIAFVVSSQVLASDRSRHYFLNILLWAITIFAVLALMQGMYSNTMRVYGIFEADSQAVGTFLYKNQFAAMMELGAPIALWRALRGRENPTFGLLFFAVLFAATVASASRAGVILLGVEFIVALIIALFRRRIPWSTAFALAGGLVLLLVAVSAVAGTDRIVEHFQEKNPFSTRQRLLESTVQMIHAHPLAGSGMGTWRLLYPRVATFDSALVANEAHNDWVQWAAEGGIPFSFLMLVLVLSTARAGFSTTWGLGVLIVMLHSLIDYPTREPALGLLWFAMAGALLHVPRRARTESLPPSAATPQRRRRPANSAVPG